MPWMIRSVVRSLPRPSPRSSMANFNEGLMDYLSVCVVDYVATKLPLPRIVLREMYAEFIGSAEFQHSAKTV